MKYRLIKEYPGSPKLGVIWDDNSPDCINYPEFWQPVVEKNYEILSYITETKTIWRKNRCNSIYFITNNSTTGLEASTLMSNIYYGQIHSIKRLSDNEIFTIGDNTTLRKLFKIENVGLEIATISGIKLSFENYNTSDLCSKKFNENNEEFLIKKVKQKLFTTEDNVNIFKDDIFWSVNSKFEKIERQITNDKWSKDFIFEDKHFSTKEKAEKYILMNKHVLSYKDIEEIITVSSKMRIDLLRRVKDKIKQKLN